MSILPSVGLISMRARVDERGFYRMMTLFLPGWRLLFWNAGSRASTVSVAFRFLGWSMSAFIRSFQGWITRRSVEGSLSDSIFSIIVGLIEGGRWRIISVTWQVQLMEGPVRCCIECISWKVLQKIRSFKDIREVSRRQEWMTGMDGRKWCLIRSCDFWIPHGKTQAFNETKHSEFLLKNGFSLRIIYFLWKLMIMAWMMNKVSQLLNTSRHTTLDFPSIRV